MFTIAQPYFKFKIIQFRPESFGEWTWNNLILSFFGSGFWLTDAIQLRKNKCCETCGKVFKTSRSYKDRKLIHLCKQAEKVDAGIDMTSLYFQKRKFQLESRKLGEVVRIVSLCNCLDLLITIMNEALNNKTTQQTHNLINFFPLEK